MDANQMNKPKSTKPKSCANCARLRADNKRLRREVADNDASFDLRWNADMRAIKLWQKSHSGNDLVWPDHGKLCEWLLEQNEALRLQLDILHVEIARLRS